jgi:hypothetical protein
VVFGSVFCLVLLVFFTVVFARLAGVGDGLVTTMTLTRQRGSAKRQGCQTKRHYDRPNQFFHDVISASFTLADAQAAKKVTGFQFQTRNNFRLA